MSAHDDDMGEHGLRAVCPWPHYPNEASPAMSETEPLPPQQLHRSDSSVGSGPSTQGIGQ